MNDHLPPPPSPCLPYKTDNGFRTAFLLQNEDMKVQREKLAKAHNEIGYLNRHIRSQDKTMIELKHEVKALRSAAAGADTDLSKQLYETQVLRIEMENLRKSLPDITKSR